MTSKNQTEYETHPCFRGENSHLRSPTNQYYNLPRLVNLESRGHINIDSTEAKLKLSNARKYTRASNPNRGGGTLKLCQQNPAKLSILYLQIHSIHRKHLQRKQQGALHHENIPQKMNHVSVHDHTL